MTAIMTDITLNKRSEAIITYKPAFWLKLAHSQKRSLRCTAPLNDINE